MLDRRAFPRQRILKEGKILLAGNAVLDCRVTDRSDGGMRIEFAAPVPLPAEFRLIMPTSNWMRTVATAWQRGLAAGVSFVGPIQSAPLRRW